MGMSVPKIVDDEFTTIRDDMERVQKKSTMYISHTGPLAYLHLGKEITNNSIDEHNNPRSISDGKIYILLDVARRTMTVEDHGRGINFDDLVNACTVLQAGTKMDRATGSTAGENGVGLTVTNALSDLFEITSARDGYARCLQFRSGKLVADRTIQTRTKDKHGLTVTFQPSQFFLGEDVEMPIDLYTEWLHKLSFFMNQELEIQLTIEGLPGKAAAVSRTFKNTAGIAGFLPSILPDADYLSKPIVLSNSMKLVEKNVPIWETDESTNETKRELVDMNRTIFIEYAINYNPSGETKFYAFCNDIENTEGGQHEDAVRSAIQAVILKIVNENKKKTDKTEILNKDILTGINVVLNLRTDYSTQFTGQTKYNLGNKELYEPIRKLAIDSLNSFLRAPENSRVLTKILEIVRTNAKIRTEETKKRSNIKKDSPTVMGSKVIVGYIPANFINRSISKDRENAQLELFVVEGDSAGGNARRARFNNDIQGVLAMKGKPPNNYAIPTRSLGKADKKTGKKHDDFYAILFDDILGCGFGDHYDESNLIYDKIILAADADVDGGHIDGLNLANIVKHCPNLIMDGHVYRIIAPLYRLKPEKGSGNSKGINPDNYLYSKGEIYARFGQNVGDQIRLKPIGSNKAISSADLKYFLEINREYYDILMENAKYYRIHPDVLEYIAMNINDFKKPKFMEKLDPELHYSKIREVISGCYKTQRYSLVLDNVVMNVLRKLNGIYVKGNHSIGFYEVYEKKGNAFSNNLGAKSIGQIFELCMKYYPNIAGRYKGLGEMTPDEMKELLMNPNNRKLYQITIDDLQFTQEIFDQLFLEKHRGIRKQMVQDANVSVDDIDN